MRDVNDMELVREYATGNSQEAFSELVRRHINLVYSVALRYTRATADAEDVVQVAFIILARKAGKLGAKTVLAGWLYETTRLTAMNLLRTKARQSAREQEAYMRSTLEKPEPETAWIQLAPILEEGMSRLSEKERTLLALRFFENKNGAETAAMLGLQVSTAHRRTSRAVEKLRHFFRRRGVVLPASAITAAISTHSVQAAPASLVTAVTATAVIKGAAVSGSILTLIQGALKVMTWAKMKTTAITAAIVFLATAAFAGSVYDAIWKNANSSSYGRLDKAPPTLIIRPTQFPNEYPHGIGIDKEVYVNESVPVLVSFAYDTATWRKALPGGVPSAHFDLLMNLPNGQNHPALKAALKKEFGLTGGAIENREARVYLLKVKDTALLQGAVCKRGWITGSFNAGDDPIIKQRIMDEPLSAGGDDYSQQTLRYFLEWYMKAPVFDRTGSTQNYDISLLKLAWAPHVNGTEKERLAALNASLQAYGLELAPAREKIPMLIIERTARTGSGNTDAGH